MAVLYTSSFSFCESQPSLRTYQRISKQQFSKVNIHDTLYNRSNYTVIESITVKPRYTDTVRYIEKRTGGRKRYYKLDEDTRFEGDTSLVYYSTPLEVSGDYAGSHKEGIWFYSKHVSEKIDSYTTDEGVQFKVDSTPPGISQIALPSLPGIYFYTTGQLVKITGDQSEETFYAYGKAGFYYLPSPGRFYKRFTISEIN